jgi:glycosyltransferase involved in cell wall biosynthesis
LELIVVDGGSQDNSRQIIEKFANHISWWCSEPDNGQTHALNKGFTHSTGEIMAWLNADDMHMPETLATVARFLSQNNNVDVVYGHRILVDENDMEVGRWILPAHSDKVMTWADFIPQETLFWRRSIWKKAGARVDESFHFAMDWELLMRFRKQGAVFHRLSKFLGIFRLHTAQKTCSQISDVGLQEMQQLRKKALGYSPSQFRCAIGVAGYLLKARLLEILQKTGIVRYA